MRSLAEPAAAFIVQSIILAGLALLAARVWATRGAAFRVAVYRTAVLCILALTVAGPAIRLIARPMWEIGDEAKFSRRAPGTDSAPPEVTASRPSSTSARAPRVPNARASNVNAEPMATPLELSSPKIVSPERSVSAFEAFALVQAGGAIVLLGVIAIGAVDLYRLKAESRPFANDLSLATAPPNRSGALSLSAAYEGEGRVGVKSNLKKSTELSGQRPISGSPSPAPGKGRRAVPILISPRIRSACAAGVFRPAIFLPEGAEDVFSADQLEAIVCHEKIHIRRSDCLWTLLARIACAVAWLNPLVWVLARELILASEELCDQLVLAEGIRPDFYAECLIRIARTRMRGPAFGLMAVGVVTSRSHLTKRVSLMLNDRLASPKFSRSSRLVVGAAATLVCLGTCLGVSASPLAAFGQESTPQATVKAFYAALDKGDWREAFSRVQGADVNRLADYVSTHPELKGKGGSLSMKLVSCEVTGDDAVAHVAPSFVPPAYVNSRNDMQIHLHRFDGSWKLVPGSGDGTNVEFLIELSKDPALLVRAVGAAKRTQIISNLKRLDLAIIMFTNDNEDVLRLNQSTLKAKLSKYLASTTKYFRDNNLWQDADGKPLDVQFNGALAGKNMTEFPESSRLALLTIGPRGNLTFYGDATPIAFADGHVKFINRADLSKVLWK